MGVIRSSMMPDGFVRYSRAVFRDKRWPVLRLAAKRRDGWCCVQCKSKCRLEVYHVKSVRTNPELAFELTNLQTLCTSCHTKKTRIETGVAPILTPNRLDWAKLVRNDARQRPSTENIGT
jgi:5-methylcytosine-specific restriction enzyme A